MIDLLEIEPQRSLLQSDHFIESNPTDVDLFTQYLIRDLLSLREAEGLVYDEILNLMAATDEAVRNAFLHGNLEGIEFTDAPAELRERIIEVHLKIVQVVPQSYQYMHGSQVRWGHFDVVGSVSVQDEGRGFDASSVTAPNYKQNGAKKAPGGLKLLREYMDDVEIEPSPQGTQVHMAKRMQSGAKL